MYMMILQAENGEKGIYASRSLFFLACVAADAPEWGITLLEDGESASLALCEELTSMVLSILNQ